jgi:hypothetical protein
MRNGLRTTMDGLLFVGLKARIRALLVVFFFNFKEQRNYIQEETSLSQSLSFPIHLSLSVLTGFEDRLVLEINEINFPKGIYFYITVY